jgi:hypothetical protein
MIKDSKEIIKIGISILDKFKINYVIYFGSLG